MVISQQVRKSRAGSIHCVQQLLRPLIGASYRKQPGHASSSISAKPLTSGSNGATSCCFTPNWRSRYTKRSRTSSSGAVNTVVEQLRGQGVLAEARLTTGQRVLVLQLGYVEQYAGALIIAARNVPRGIPVLEELAIARGTVPLPGIKPDERLNAIQERVVLDCVVQLLVDHGIGLRHAGQLIFPALFPETTAADEANIAQTVSLYYDFSAVIDNLYSSLVVSLALSGPCPRPRAPVEDRAQYEQPGAGVCGVQDKSAQRPGTCGFVLLAEASTDATRQLFTVFVEEHLRHEGVEIKEVLAMARARETASPRSMSKVVLTRATRTSVVRGAMPAGVSVRVPGKRVRAIPPALSVNWWRSRPGLQTGSARTIHASKLPSSPSISFSPTRTAMNPCARS